MERKRIPSNQRSFDMQLRLPEAAVITITTSGQAPIHQELIPRVDPLDVEKRYPKEPPVDPELISSVIETFRTLGDDHEKSMIAREKLQDARQIAQKRGFTLEAYFKELEKVFAESTRNFEGPKLGDEHSKIMHLREILEVEGLENWELKNSN